MRRLSVFNMISLDGFFTDSSGDMSWAHRHDPEWMQFVQSNASQDGVLLFGRTTYDMMASFWPTPMAAQAMPLVAERMNSATKIVFSRSLTNPNWANTSVVSHNIAQAVADLKQQLGPDMVIMGSGSIVAQLTQARLIDEYQMVVCPVVIGAGRTMFQGVDGKLDLRLIRSRVFANGNTVLWYERS